MPVRRRRPSWTPSPGSETDAGDVTLVVSSPRALPAALPHRRPAPQGCHQHRGRGLQLVGLVGRTRWPGCAPTLARPTSRRRLGRAAEQQRVANGLVAATWAAGYVLALGAVVLALVAGRRAGAGAAARRPGHHLRRAPRSGWAIRRGRSPRSRAWEVGYAVLAAAVAAASAGAACSCCFPRPSTTGDRSRRWPGRGSGRSTSWSSWSCSWRWWCCAGWSAPGGPGTAMLRRCSVPEAEQIDAIEPAVTCEDLVKVFRSATG